MGRARGRGCGTQGFVDETRSWIRKNSGGEGVFRLTFLRIQLQNPFLRPNGDALSLESYCHRTYCRRPFITLGEAR